MKREFVGYTTKDINPCWASLYDNRLNLSAVIQKTFAEAVCRYEKGIVKVKVTVEVIK